MKFKDSLEMEIPYLPETNFSFLRARDPSILSWNRPAINPAVKVDLRAVFSEQSSSSLCDNDPKTSSAEHIQVYLRIKPSNSLKELYEIRDEKILLCKVPDGSQSLRNMRDGDNILKKFSFTKIFGPDISQNAIFNDSVKEKVLDFINGKNCTIFTYGASGSGKTFTILGEAIEPGIIPRSLEYMFRTLPTVTDLPAIKPISSNNVKILDPTASKTERDFKLNMLNLFSNVNRNIHVKTYKTMQQRLSTEPAGKIMDIPSNVAFAIWVSFAEVYNEYVYDVLQPAAPHGRLRPKLRLGQDEKGNTYIKNLTNVSVSSGLEAYEILQYGKHNLNYASTSVNSHSSRSHCIFTISLVQATLSGSEVQITHFNFCDLAGSERVKISHSVGERLKESNNINTSLHVLGRCIESIRKSQKSNDSRLIPFRESKLTRLFQPALSGQESIAMIVNVNPDRDMFDESQHVLNFSAIAKDVMVEISAKPAKIKLKNKFSQYIQSGRNEPLSTISEDDVSENRILRDQIQELCSKLESQQNAVHEREVLIRNELTTVFQKHIDTINESWKRRCEEQRTKAIESYERRIADIEKYYNNLLDSERATKPRIYDLNETLYDELDSLKEELTLKTNDLEQITKNFNEIQDTNSSLQADNTRLSFELQISKTDLKRVQNELKEVEKNLEESKMREFELKGILKDAEIEYKDLENQKNTMEHQLEEQTCELFNLHKECSDLTAQLSAQAIEQVEQAEYVEELEEKINDSNIVM